ncbi:hypothetical protein JTE90_008109 [Oedothorax gibbosus]|uniref:Uncharacterized protein n=1 Tax=Oedothorax gibbosus TaxID=931172 RepID=A0AAV6V1Q3_9ARAC|nr:hypothetical protein JTE90_008109 [Oedothorax gibbosus]
MFIDLLELLFINFVLAFIWEAVSLIISQLYGDYTFNMSQKNFFPPDPIIPSTVTSKEDVYAFATDFREVYKAVEDRSKFGEWMVFQDAIERSPALGLTRLDYAWQFIKRLVENNSSKTSGILYASCTTAWKGERPADPNSTFGVIACWTVDYEDKMLVKKAANAIREVYDYQKNLYYKTLEATLANKYRHLGDRFISLYKYTVKGEMFERDEDDPSIWNRV